MSETTGLNSLIIINIVISLISYATFIILWVIKYGIKKEFTEEPIIKTIPKNKIKTNKKTSYENLKDEKDKKRFI
jgi:hypothetical protein